MKKQLLFVVIILLSLTGTAQQPDEFLTADHYFLINDGKAKTVALKFASKSYKTIIDAITGETVNPGAIALQSNNGCWIRCEK